MRRGIKALGRPILLLVIITTMVYYIYIEPGYSNNTLILFYNIFAGLVLLGSIILYYFATLDSNCLLHINKIKSKPDVHKKWKALWSIYESGFLSGHRKTTESAQSYFNADNLLSASSERIPVLAILKAMPGTFTGLGILGTFMGFSAGLANFNTSSAESMQESIKTLLTGINTAFNTSIIGVVLSIVFNFLFLQPLLKRLDMYCDIMNDRIDNEFYIDSIDHLKEMVAFEVDGAIWLPKDYNREILKEIKSQSVSLANFTTDLSDSMQNLADSLVSSYRQEMMRMINEELKPILEQLAISASRLQEEKSESTDQALQGIIQRLEKTLNGFLNNFQENIAGKAKEEMNEVAGRLKEAGESIAILPGMLGKLKANFEAMTDQNIKVLNEVTLQGSSLQSQSINEIKNLSEQMRLSMETFIRTISSAETQNKHAEKIAESLEEVADATSAAANDLNRSFKEQASHSESLISSIGKEAEELRSAIGSIQAAVQGFNSLDQALTRSFETMNQGLKQYNETTKDGLSGHLEAYSSTITRFAQNLVGAVDQLREMVEELTDAMENRKHN